jgi:hypothetical protein
VRGAPAHPSLRRREVHHAEPATAATTSPPTRSPTGLPLLGASGVGAPATAGRADSPWSVGPDADDVEPEAAGAAADDVAALPPVVASGAGLADALVDDGLASERAVAAPPEPVLAVARGFAAVGLAVGVGVGSGTTGAHSPFG